MSAAGGSGRVWQVFLKTFARTPCSNCTRPVPRRAMKEKVVVVDRLPFTAHALLPRRRRYTWLIRGGYRGTWKRVGFRARARAVPGPARRQICHLQTSDGRGARGSARNFWPRGKLENQTSSCACQSASGTPRAFHAGRACARRTRRHRRRPQLLYIIAIRARDLMPPPLVVSRRRRLKHRRVERRPPSSPSRRRQRKRAPRTTSPVAAVKLIIARL